MIRLAALLVALLLALLGCTTPADDSPAPESSSGAGEDRKAERPLKEKRLKDRTRHKKQQPEQTRLYTVLGIVDGDTIEVDYRGGVSVRVIGIDTPETVSPSVSDECWGRVASNVAAKLLIGRRVALTFDPTQGRFDRYGRTLGYLAIPKVGDYGLTMIERGHAAEYTYDSAYRNQQQYQSAESRARAYNRAIWGKCGGPDRPLKQAARPQPQPVVGRQCTPGYDRCVPSYPPDVNCSDVSGPIRISGPDPHMLDADGDGTACD